jgi:UDP-N-acetyl-D-galactosamine dehydrogenase
VIAGRNQLVPGLSLRQDRPNLRNTRVVDVIDALPLYGMEQAVLVPWVDLKKAQWQYNLTMLATVPAASRYGGIIDAERNRQFVGLSDESWRSFLNRTACFWTFRASCDAFCSPCVS